MRCQICNHHTRPILSKEQNVSCGDYFTGQRIYADNRGTLTLSECESCGFATFDALNAWSEETFRKEIYNEDYHLCDPPFGEARPRKICNWLSSFMPRCEIIDYGGGEGQLAAMLNQNGFTARSYDPFYGDAFVPGQSAEVVTAFEVVEHVPQQRRLFSELAALCKQNGVMIFSTLLKPLHLSQDWWYASARNGHVSFHTQESLANLMQELDLGFISLSDEIHLAVHDKDRLTDIKKWPHILINEWPPYKFCHEWDRLDNIKAEIS